MFGAGNSAQPLAVATALTRVTFSGSQPLHIVTIWSIYKFTIIINRFISQIYAATKLRIY